MRLVMLFFQIIICIYRVQTLEMFNKEMANAFILFPYLEAASILLIIVYLAIRLFAAYLLTK